MKYNKKIEMYNTLIDKGNNRRKSVLNIIGGIIESEVIIADITPVNANVFYELGYAHAFFKPTILLAQRGTQLPFDLSGYRVIFYDDSIKGKREVEEKLRKHLKSIIK